MNDDIFDALRNIKIPKLEVPQMEKITPNYAKMYPLFESSQYSSPQEVINKEDERQNYLTFENFTCKICNDSLDSKYSWYYLKHMKDEEESLALCSLACLKAYYDENPIEIRNYEIIGYSRCSAYYKCKELDNLRGKCERHENLTNRNMLIKPFVNFCESAQAGVILSTYKMNEILKIFAEQSRLQANESNAVLRASARQNKEQYEESTKMLKDSTNESKKQFKTTLAMTILTIVLTIVNISIAILTYKNNDSVNELKAVNMKLTNIQQNLSAPKAEP